MAISPSGVLDSSTTPASPGPGICQGEVVKFGLQTETIAHIIGPTVPRAEGSSQDG